MTPPDTVPLDTRQQFIRFAAVGLAGTGAHYALLIGLREVWGVAVVPATVAGSLLGALVNYALNRHFTFRSSKSHRVALPQFLLIAGMGVLLNGLLMAMLASQMYYLLAQVISTGLVLVWNFLGNKLWTFRDTRP